MNTPSSSCRYIIDEMLRDPFREKFGLGTDSKVDVALPLTLQAREQDLIYTIFSPPTLTMGLTYAWVVVADGKCQVVINTEGPTVKSSWEKVWESIEATVALCVRAGKGGRSKVACE